MRRLLGSKRMHFTAVMAGIGLCLWAMSSGLPALAQAPPQGVETMGTPWYGDLGVTETVDEIMARARIDDAFIGPKLRVQIEPQEVDREHLPQNPDAPAVSQWPPKDLETADFFGKTDAPKNPQTVGTSFLGVQISETPGWIPPDSMGAVGPDQVMVAVNGRIRAFDKTGVLGGLDSDTDTFFASVMTSGSGTSDPHVRYDRLSQRWFVSMIDVATPNRVLIAVSSGSHITNSSSFTFFQFQHDLVGTTPNSDTGGFADYDTLGLDANALYIGANIFNAAGTAFLGSTGYVVRKSSVISGGPIVVTPFRQLCSASGAGPYTPQGVDNDDPSATQGYFIGVDSASYSLLQVRRVSNPGGTPSISGNLSITVPTTYAPRNVPASGTSTTLDPLDDRLFAAAIHKNKLSGTSSLWTAHNIRVNSSGVGGSTGTYNRDACRWYEIGSLSTTPALSQSGTLYDSTGTNPRWFWMPSVAMSGQGHMALGCSMAGTLYRAEIGAAGRLSSDAAGTTQAYTLAQSSTTAYDVTVTNPQRWGDYSQVVVDPNDDQTMWTFQEYCNAANSWAVRAIQLKAPLPATPASCSPAAVCAGATNVSVTLTGTSTSGTAFFDPGPDTGGPGFANHISSSVSGSGVTVNSTTFTDSTHVTLNITIAAGAAAGARDITVTNPDGQTKTGTGILTINALPAAPAAPTFTSVGQTTLTVNWSAVSGATSYDVWRASGATCAGAVKITASPVAGTSYPDTGLSCNSPYSYFVVANNGCGASANGTCASQTTAACASPPLRVPYSVTPTKMTTSSHGTNGTVTWDVTHCASTNYHIIYGKGENLAAWTVDGGE